MTIKLLLFGNITLISHVTGILRGAQQGLEGEEVKVETIMIADKQFLLFSIPDRGLIGSQATGSNGLVFFLDPTIALFQQKQFLFELLRQKRQFDGLPIAIGFEKDQDITIKDVINYFQLFKVKDRPSMIKEISLDQLDTILDIFKWIHSQNQFRNTKTFNAQPKIVKVKPKYRQSDPEAAQDKYDSLMKEKNFKILDAKEQQQTYVAKEKERLKDQNMKAQLSNFNKNKKKMAPYDVKPTHNPKIQPNLHFFLKDPKNQKQPEVNIKIQTDEFKPRPKSKPYVPKKTGINIATQIQQNQLFDFDKEVKPILDILTTKALQMASLEIQEEEQFSKMAKYKAIYNQKIKKQKNHQAKNIQQEKDLIQDKNKLLEKYRLKDQAKKNITRKVTNYSISNQFLQPIYSQATNNLYNRHYFKNTFQQFLKTDYLEHLIDRSVKSYHQILDKQQTTKGLFEKDCVQPIIGKVKQIKLKHEQKKQQSEKRKINQSKNQRYINLFYQHHQTPTFSSFSKFINKYFQGTLDQFVKNKQDQIQQLQDKMNSNEITEDQLKKFKNLQNQQFSKKHTSFLLTSEELISFQVTSNQYEQEKQNYITPGIIAISKQNVPLFTHFFDDKKQFDNYIRYVTKLRNPRAVINMDEGFILNLRAAPQQIKSFIFIIRVNDVGKFIGQANSKKFKSAAYLCELYQRSIQMNKNNVGQTIKWQDIIKQPQGQQVSQLPKQNIYIISYLLTRKYDMNTWHFEDIKYISKTIKIQDEKLFFQDLTKFFRQSIAILKNEDEQQVQRAASAKRLSSRQKKRTKSKKVIEEQQLAKKKVTLNQVISKILPGVSIDLVKQTFQIASHKLDNCVRQWKQFTQFCGELGWEIVDKENKKIQSVQELKKFKKIGDLKVRKFIQKIEEQVQQKRQVGEGEQENIPAEQE